MIYFFITYILSIILYLAYQFIGYRHNLSQTERSLGPSSHKSKNGTLTGGGSVFVILSVVVFWVTRKPSLDALFLTLPFFSYFLIGLADDLIIIRKKDNAGISPRMKLILEGILALIFYGIYIMIGKNSLIVFLGLKVDLGVFYIVVFTLMYMGMANSFNITDGLDGLLITLSMEMLIAFFFIARAKNEIMVMELIIIVIAAMSGFYYFNHYRAIIFMGDAGSLALGGLILSIALYLDALVVYIILSLPLIWEITTVILQVLYFKLTKGKRLFKMAPFHHHLESLGYSETIICSLFALMELILVLVCLYLYKII